MIDSFTWFCLSHADREFLKPYRSPPEESSIFKWIPVAEKPRAQRICRQLGIRARIVYRGPRQPWCSWTTSSAATHFTVYPKG